MCMDAMVVRGWEAHFDYLADEIGGCFRRRDLRRRASAYVRGLLGPVQRKNGWQLAEQLGDATQSTQTLFPFEAFAFCGKTEFHKGIQAGIKVENQGTFGVPRQKNQIKLFQGVLGSLCHICAPNKLKDHITDTGTTDGMNAF